MRVSVIQNVGYFNLIPDVSYLWRNGPGQP